MSDASARPRRSPFGGKPDEGPRAGFRQLLPYLAEHRGVLAIVIALSLASAAASLAQPLLVSQVIGIVEKGEALGVFNASSSVAAALGAFLGGWGLEMTDFGMICVVSAVVVATASMFTYDRDSTPRSLAG